MIVNLARFVETEERYWTRLEELLAKLKTDPWRRPTLEEARELDYLYRRTAADLARITTFSAEPEMRRRLEVLVSRAFAEVHGRQAARANRFRPWRWLATTLPRAFRQQRTAMLFSLAVTMAGVVFGAIAVAVDPEAKEVIMPFSHLVGDPADRVAEEEAATEDRLSGHYATFAGELMTHNTKITLFVLALGMTWGVGTTIILFYNGVVLGAVVIDYLLAGQGTFLCGWLLPHGVVEIPAILVGGQAGYVLARAMVGRDDGRSMGQRLRAVAPDVATLAGGAALMLVWAGLVESYLSQHHEPVIPYALKILIGVGEGTLLVLYYGFAGRRNPDEEAAHD